MESNMNGSAMMPLMDKMMSMNFHFSRTVPGGLLFSQWRVDSVREMVGAIVAVFFMAVLYEAIKTFREYLVFMDWKHWSTHSKRTPLPDTDDDTDVGDRHAFININAVPKNKGFKYYSISISMHLTQSALHVVQVGYAYLLMLVVMTFNGWLFLSVCFGSGVGYLLCAKSRHLMGNFREQNEHCH